jgi:hypothetical protein
VTELRDTLYILIIASFNNKSVGGNNKFILPIQSIAQDKCQTKRETNVREIETSD